MTHSLLGETVHYVRATDLGARCTAALVTSVAGAQDAYRDHATVGLVARTDTEEIGQPLLLGGVRHDVGTPADDHTEYRPDTWHYRADCRGLP